MSKRRIYLYFTLMIWLCHAQYLGIKLESRANSWHNNRSGGKTNEKPWRTDQKARESQHFTQCEVAEELRVARSTVSNWECGRAEPDLRTLQHLSGFLQYDLLGEHREDTADQEENIRKLRLKLSDSPVFEVISSENACVFSDFTINLQVNGSDSHGNSVIFRVNAAFCIENDGK